MRRVEVKPKVRTVLEAQGFIDSIGNDHVHGNVARAVEAQLAEGMHARPTPGG